MMASSTHLSGESVRREDRPNHAAQEPSESPRCWLSFFTVR